MKKINLKLIHLATTVVLFLGGVIFVQTAMPALTPNPTDPQILKIVETTNDGEILTSELAKKSQNPDVRKMASDMRKGHRDLNKKIDDLARAMNVKKEDSAMSVQLKADATARLTELKMNHDVAFDRKYVEAMVAGHQEALSNFDQTLIPNAKNPALKSTLLSARKEVAAHLANAKRLQEELAK